MARSTYIAVALLIVDKGAMIARYEMSKRTPLPAPPQSSSTPAQIRTPQAISTPKQWTTPPDTENDILTEREPRTPKKTLS